MSTTTNRDPRGEAADRADRLRLPGAARHASAGATTPTRRLASQARSALAYWRPINRTERRRLRVQLIVLFVLAIALALAAGVTVGVLTGHPTACASAWHRLVSARETARATEGKQGQATAHENAEEALIEATGAVVIACKAAMP